MLTVDNLRTSFYVTERCYMCKRNVETIDHLFFHCDATRLLWNDVLASQHVKWVFLRCMEGVLKHGGEGSTTRVASLYGILFRVTAYGVRGERNIRCFKYTHANNRAD